MTPGDRHPARPGAWSTATSDGRNDHDHALHAMMIGRVRFRLVREGTLNAEPSKARRRSVAAAGLLAVVATLGGASGCAPAALRLQSISVPESTVTGGQSVTGTVTLTGSAPAGGAKVTLSSNKASAVVPASVTVAEGTSAATFTVTTATVAADELVYIKATYSNDFRTAQFTITAPPPPTLTSVAVSPATVQGGTSSTGTVTLTGPAQAGGATVSLASSSASAVVPASVTVAVGNTAATFTVATTAVTADESATITATLSGTNQTAPLTITALPPPPPTLASVTVSPATVPGGSSATGTVTLTGPAQVDGATVALSSNSAWAVVPASVTVALGSSTATFSVTTSTVSADQTVTISADYGGLTRTAPLLLTATEECALSTPGAQWLAFSSKKSGVFDIYAMRDDGTCLVQVTNDSTNDFFVTWSPAGTLAYMSIRGSTRQVWIRDFNSGVESLLDVGTLGATSPAYSPDGRFIAFEGNEPGVTTVADIYVVPASGGVPLKLTNGPTFNAGPAWSPDGSEIYFVSNRTGLYDVWKVPATGGVETQVTVSSGILGRPAVSPRGDSIAYTRFAGGGALYEVVIQPLPTGTLRVLSSMADQEPTFDRTGDRMVVTSYRPLDPLGNPELWLLDVATGAPVRQLTFDPGMDGMAAYGPFP